MTRTPFLFCLMVSLSCSPIVSVALGGDTDSEVLPAVIPPIPAGAACPPCECPSITLLPSPSQEAIQKAFDAIEAVELAEQSKEVPIPAEVIVPPTLPQALPPK